MKEETVVKLQDWTGALTDSVARVAQTLLAYLPALLGAIALLLLGWLAARLLRGLSMQIATRAMGRLAGTKPIEPEVERSQSYRSVPTLTARVVYWTVFLFFVAAALEQLGLHAVSNMLALVTAYLPRILFGILIVFVGIWSGAYVRGLIVRAARRAGVAQGALVGRIAQLLVALMVGVVAIEEIGIQSAALVTSLAAALAATLGAIGLAFGLGARTTVSNLIAAHYLQDLYRVGDLIRVGELEGRIVEIGRVAVLIESEQGRVTVPAQRFSEDVSVLLRKERS